jgi:hypothetical protein
MSDRVDPAKAITADDDDPSAGNTLERQILADVLATSLRFGLMVAAVVLAAHALSPA